jgi:peptidoglycan/LPS O-acetylase OafA/YrhL
MSRKLQGVYKNSFYPGIDLLRAFFSIAVLSLHTGLFSGIENSNPNIFYFIRYHIEFAAVPVFFVISMFLFIRKFDNNYKKRILNIFNIYAVWRFIHFITMQWPYHPNYSIENIVYWILGSESPTYYCLELAILMAIYSCLIKFNLKALLSTKIAIFSFIILGIILMLFAYIFVQLIKLPLGYNNPLLYIIYIPIAFFAHYTLNMKQEFPFIILILLLICIGFAEFQIQNLNIHIDGYNDRPYQSAVYFSYARIGVVLEALVLVYICIHFENAKKLAEANIIKFISKNSLGIYLIHPIINSYLATSLYLTRNKIILFACVSIISIGFSWMLNLKNMIKWT